MQQIINIVQWFGSENRVSSLSTSVVFLFFPLYPFWSCFTSSLCYTLRLYIGQFARSWRNIGCVRPLIQGGATSTLVNKQRSYVPWLPNEQAELRVLAICKSRTQVSSENTDLTHVCERHEGVLACDKRAETVISDLRCFFSSTEGSHGVMTQNRFQLIPTAAT